MGVLRGVSKGVAKAGGVSKLGDTTGGDATTGGLGGDGGDGDSGGGEAGISRDGDDDDDGDADGEGGDTIMADASTWLMSTPLLCRILPSDCSLMCSLHT